MFNINKNFVKALAAVTAIAAVGTAIPVSAENSYTPISGGTVVFDKYLILDANTNALNVDFAFAAEGVDDIVGDDGYVTVFSGEKVGIPTISAASFNSSSTRYSTVQDRDTSIDGSRGTFDPANFPKDAVVLPDGKEYAKATATIDFSNLQFTEPGVFRWKITEVPDADMQAKGVVYSTEARYVDVYVNTKTFDESTGKGTLEITAYIIHNDGSFRPAADNEHAPAGDSDYVKAKAKGFTNTYDSVTFTIDSTAGGNQADRTKYFKYSVGLSNAGNGTKVTLSGDKYDPGTVEEGKTNPTEVTTGTDGSVNFDVFMQPGQQVDLKGLPKNATIDVRLDPEEYDLTMVDENGNPIIDGDGNVRDPYGKYIKVDPEGKPYIHIVLSDPLIDPDNIPPFEFKLIKDGVIPTGVITTVLPGMLLMLIGGAAAHMILKKRGE